MALLFSFAFHGTRVSFSPKFNFPLKCVIVLGIQFESTTHLYFKFLLCLKHEKVRAGHFLLLYLCEILCILHVLLLLNMYVR